MSAERLKELRKQRGLSLDDMAKITGYAGKSGYWALENGVVKASVDQAKNIALALGINISEVVDLLAAARAEHEQANSEPESAG